ncbi:hypothetical protein EI555_008479, partial [Monodon monoceros]
VAGPLPAEEPGRVRPGTHVEEEERDDKVWSPPGPLRARFRSDPPQGVGVGEAPRWAPSCTLTTRCCSGWSPRLGGEGVGVGKRRDGGGKETGPREAHPGPAGAQRQEAARRAGAKPMPPPRPGPSGLQTSLLAPGLGVGDGHAEEAVPLEPSGEAGPGLVPVPGVGRAPGHEGVELSGLRSQALPVGREGCDEAVPTGGEDGAAHSPRLPGRASSWTLLSAAVRSRDTQAWGVCAPPRAAGFLRGSPARHLLLRNPRRPCSFPRAHCPAAEPKGAGGFTPNLRKPHLGAGTQAGVPPSPQEQTLRRVYLLEINLD